MMHRRRLTGVAVAMALAGAMFASMLFAASAEAAPCFFFFFCPPPPHTTTTTTSTTSRSSSTVTSTTITSTSTTVSSTRTSSTTTSTTATSTTATSSSTAVPGVSSLTEIPAGSGEHGYPYDAVPQTPTITGAPYFDLSALGYVENEYLMSGTTNIYNESGSWGSNGDWSVSVAQKNVPYTTRLLVRYHTNPAKFNGIVVIEWLNDTTGGDQDPVWSELDSQLLNDGYAYIGVTAQNAGMGDLKTWDPERYGSLGDTNDGQSYDIFTQTAEVARDDSATLLGGLSVKRVIGAGDSQSAFRLDTYVNAFQPVSHAFNAFMAIGRAVVAAPIGSGLIATSPFPALIRTNNTAPFIQINTQGDILELDAGAARQADNADLRTWEVAGASHIDAHEAEYEIETIARENPTLPVPACVFGTPIEGTGTALDGINQTNNMPLFEVEDAGLAALQNWLVNGVPAPHEPSSLSATSIFGLLYIPNTNQYGIAGGGIQLPEAQVPTEDYSAINFSTVSASEFNPLSLVSEVESALQTLSSGSITNSTVRAAGLCLLSGYFTDLGNSTLESLYPSLSDYVAKYTAAVNTEEAAGFITPADATAAIANAQAGEGPLQTPAETIP
jgi:hypothetical protein